MATYRAVRARDAKVLRNPALSSFLDTLASYTLYGFLLFCVNAAFAAGSPAVENDYKDAVRLFEQRDMVSQQKAISMLEHNLEVAADHIDSQALIAYAYASEAQVLTQLGESAKDYLASSEGFAAAVIEKQPKNIYARKTQILLAMMKGQQADAVKFLAQAMADADKDADLWYMQAALSDGEKSTKALARALELNANHVWIYSDMAFRALHLNNIAVAEKWLAALEARAPGLADADLIRAVIAAQKKDKKAYQQAWLAFSNKMPDSPIVARLTGRPVPAKKST